MKISLFRILVTAALLWGGGQSLYTALVNREPLSISVDDYLKTRPEAKWLNLTGGRFGITGMSYTGNKYTKSITEVFIPLRPTAQTVADDRVHVLVASKDPAMIALATKMRDARTESDVIKILADHGEMLAEQSISGLVRFGIDLTEKEAGQLRELHEDLADDFVIISSGEKPSAAVGIVMLAGGVVLGLLMIKRIIGGKVQPPPLPTTSVR